VAEGKVLFVVNGRKGQPYVPKLTEKNLVILDEVGRGTSTSLMVWQLPAVVSIFLRICGARAFLLLTIMN